ncbi:hypothetical protein M3196_00035 [Fictibacillus nanhaiensis]|uniref:hypothetical protein n=1 Tax=Fictibacillus nanhaiensis TaxID=742169 RepID=UPI0020408206|nr:hypothetical protein [Fictibacillus nanhaiensis]MCM3730057.1 hypothetical protein [Fictibacillus nanhaiensis]
MKTIFEVLGYIASVSVLSGILLFSIRALIKSKINNYFSTALENHKHDLSLITEQTRFDYQRKIHDFGLYSGKRHEYYPILYGKILRMHREIRGFYINSTFHESFLTSKNSFIDFIDSKKMHDQRRELLLTLYENGTGTIDVYKKQIKDAKLLEVFELINSVHDYCYDNDLYFSANVSTILEEIFIIVRELMEIIKKDQYNYSVEDQLIIQRNYNEVIELKNCIKDELSKGYYENKESN